MAPDRVPEPLVDLPAEGVLRAESGLCQRGAPLKFQQDKVFAEDDDALMCVDSLLLNAKELRARHSVDDNFALWRTVLIPKGGECLGSLRGSFAGVVFDKRAGTWLLFTDHLGTKQLFYHWDEAKGLLLFASDLGLLVRAMRRCGYTPSLSETGAYQLLHYGYMLGDHTLVEGVHRLAPGSILTFDGAEVGIRQYFRLDNTPDRGLSEADCVQRLHELFSLAIKQEYDKDRECGYRHVATLSGGLDSRMNVFYAKSLGYEDVVAVTFSQSGYHDERIARRIARDLQLPFLFHSLDRGDYLRDVESPVAANGGLVTYAGSAHMLSMLRLLNWRDLGLLHSGMLGDAIMGTYLRGPRQETPRELSSVYSPLLADRVRDTAHRIAGEYANNELFRFYSRGVNSILNGYWTAQRFTEIASPFLHVDVLAFVMTVPPEMRYRGLLYRKWMAAHRRDAMRYVHERTGCRPDTPRPLERILARLRTVRSVLGQVSGLSPQYSMNPFDFWFKTNPRLREALNGWFDSHVSLLRGRSQLVQDCQARFEQGSVREKQLSVTLLAAMKAHQLN